jgi:hypothetical protein
MFPQLGDLVASVRPLLVSHDSHLMEIEGLITLEYFKDDIFVYTSQ